MQSVIILVVGVPGSGKTTLSKKLCKQIENSTYLSKDMIQGAFTEKGLDGEAYSIISKPTQKIFLSFCDEQLQLGKIPIIDSPYSINNWRGDEYKEFWNFYDDIAQKNNAKLVILKCIPPNEEALKERITKRNLIRDNWKLENWDEFLKREPIEFPIDYKHVLKVTSGENGFDVEKIISDISSIL